MKWPKQKFKKVKQNYGSRKIVFTNFPNLCNLV